jgi:uncharacterized membrane protein
LGLSPGSTWGYSYSTLSGLGPLWAFSQVPPGAIHIQPFQGWGLFGPFPRFHLGLFIFNPFRVGASLGLSPGSTWGYFYYLAPLGTKFQPFQGWGLFGPFFRLLLWPYLAKHQLWRFWTSATEVLKIRTTTFGNIMIILILGIALFFGMHLVPSFPTTRQTLINRFGTNRYKSAYSIIAVIGLTLIIFGKSQAEYIPIWQPGLLAFQIAPYIILLGFIISNAMYMPSNIKRFTRHPMLWGVAFWSLGHLLTNGDLSSLILFGCFGLFSLFDMYSANRRGATKSTQTYPLTKDLILIVVGIISWGIFLYLHSYLFGVPVIQYLSL